MNIHVSVSWLITGLDNGVLPIQSYYPNHDLLSFGPLQTNVNEIWVKLQ